MTAARRAEIEAILGDAAELPRIDDLIRAARDLLAELDRRSGAEDDGEGDGPAWRDRLAFDRDLCATSPVVRGTWITAAQVVALITVLGRTWGDVLRAHPELTEDDIRACLMWSIEDDGADRGR